MKSKIMPTAVLGIICLVSALLLALINIPTEAKIKENQSIKENAALYEVYETAGLFTPINNFADYDLPAEVTAVSAASNGGYVFKLEVSGYKPGLVIMCGVDGEGKITGVKDIASAETWGHESYYNEAYVGTSSADLDRLVASGATPNSETSKGYYNAMSAALDAYATLTEKGVTGK